MMENFLTVSIKDGSGTISLPELRRACQKRHIWGGSGWIGIDGWKRSRYLEMFITRNPEKNSRKKPLDFLEEMIQFD